ncbi:hypothetical protein C0J52_24777 [Blattella germanica]|nr:hypothetical protein C0J52_24777 [Blattella germanica]
MALVWDVYKLKLNSPLYMKLVGNWHYFSPNEKGWDSQIYFPSYEHKLLMRSQNLDGITLRVGVLVGKPDYEFDCKVEQDMQGQITTVQGYSAVILQVLMDHLHFRVEFVGSDTWGSQDDEGVWVGLLGLLAEDDVDLVLCHPTISAERTASAQFLHSTLRSRYIILSIPE